MVTNSVAAGGEGGGEGAFAPGGGEGAFAPGGTFPGAEFCRGENREF